MYYVSQFLHSTGQYIITDTTDGVGEPHSVPEILHIVNDLKIPIKGVKGQKITVVSMSDQIIDSGLNGLTDKIKKMIMGWTQEDMLNFARGASFVRAAKAAANVSDNELRKVVFEKIYSDSVREVINDAQKYSNSFIDVPLSIDSIKNALRSNVCLVIQKKTNGLLTAFLCTANMNIMDTIYAKGFFESMYLTKQLYEYTHNIDKLRKPAETKEKVKNPSYLNVMSCSLRFRNDGKNHDKLNKVLSSAFYTVNMDQLVAIYVLDKPNKMGNTILSEMRTVTTNNMGNYDFNFVMYQQVTKCVRDHFNYFSDSKMFTQYVDPQKGGDLTYAMERFQSDFGYIMHIMDSRFSFS